MNFPEVELSDSLIDKASSDSCASYLATLNDEEPESFSEYFGHLEPSSLNSSLVRVSYVKNIVVDDLSDHFEQPTEFLFHCMRFIFAFDEAGDKNHLATYVLVIDQNMNAMDDYLL